MLLGIKGCSISTLKSSFECSVDQINIWLRAFMLDKLAGVRPYKIYGVPHAGFVNQSVLAAKNLALPVQLVIPEDWRRSIPPVQRPAYESVLAQHAVLYVPGSDFAFCEALVAGIAEHRYVLVPGGDPPFHGVTNLWDEFSEFVRRAKELKNGR